MGRLKEYCGVFGIFGHPRAARLTYYGLLALQHRGQEGAGMAVSDGKRLRLHRGVGLVAATFGSDDLDRLHGAAAIGQTLHVRRGGTAIADELQPLFVNHRLGDLAFCYNGSLTNADELRHKLEDAGSIFHTRVDIEVVAHLVARYHREPLPAALGRSLAELAGGYAGLWMTPKQLLASRDPHGIRPLCLGKIEWMGDGDPVLPGAHHTAWVVASETCALDTVGAEFVRDIEPGELLVIDEDGLQSTFPGNADGPMALPDNGSAAHAASTAAAGPRLCSFEFVYFARPDSVFNERNVHIVRKNLGRELAREQPVDADVVIGVPDSSLAAASGYAEEAGLPYEVGLIKNRYIGRTFIKPTKAAREQGVLFNLNAVRQVVAGRRVVLVDDSVVRGTTSVRLTELLRAAGAKEVHMRISSPSFRHACPYGLDTADEGQLVATGRTDEEIEQHIGADSLRFLSPEGMLRAFGASGSLHDQFRGTYGRDGQLWAGSIADAVSRVDTVSRVDAVSPGGAAADAEAGIDPSARNARNAGNDQNAQNDRGEYCLACFTGRYPVPLAGPGREATDAGGLEAGAPMEGKQ